MKFEKHLSYAQHKYEIAFRFNRGFKIFDQ